MRFIPADDPREAAAVREIDLQRRYPHSRKTLADLIGLSQPRAAALRSDLAIDPDEACHHVFAFGQSTHHRYSAEALKRMREAIAEGIDLERIWEEHRPRRRS